MRQILFRGKALEEKPGVKIGEWVYGSLVKRANREIYIYDYEMNEEIKVNPDTVKEGTGIYCLKDGRKTEIFEDDILAIKNKIHGFTSIVTGIVCWDKEEAGFYIELEDDFLKMTDIPSDTEIIGEYSFIQ